MNRPPALAFDSTADALAIGDHIPTWTPPQWRDNDPKLTIRYRSLLSGVGTILLHLLLLIFLVQQTLHVGEDTPQSLRSTIYLLPNRDKATAQSESLSPPIENSKAITPPIPRPHAITPPRPLLNVPPPEIEPEKVAPPTPIAAQAPVMAPPPAADLASYMKAMRDRKAAAEGRPNEPSQASAEEIRDANIKRNLQPQGTNGVFQIVSKSVSHATVRFNGWTGNNAQREIIEVDAPGSLDIDHEIVRKVIELIRRYYKGDFNWDSQRLGRVIPLSARPQDNAALEEFLLRELFGTNRNAAAGY